MNCEIVDIKEKSIDEILHFYVTYGDGNPVWYQNKLQKSFESGRLLGKLCIASDSKSIIGAYLGINQPLLSNPSLKSVQSIDTLISPQARGGGVIRKIARAFYDELANSGYDCVYGLPNKRIEKIRYKVLGWNESRLTYRYIVPIPAFVLRIALRLLSFLSPNLISFGAKSKGVEQIKSFAQLNDKIQYIHGNGMLSCSYKKGWFQKVGVIRTGQELSVFGKFRALCLLSVRSEGFFLLTYATQDSETGSLFAPFSIKKEALKFSGINLINLPRFSFGEAPFEFVEFDTYGLI